MPSSSKSPTVAHKSEIYALAAKLSGTSLTTVQHIPFVIGSGIDVRMIQPVIDYAARNKFIAKSFPAAEWIDPLIAGR